MSICDGTTHVQIGRTSAANGTTPSPASRIARRLPPLRFLSFSDPFTRQPHAQARAGAARGSPQGPPYIPSGPGPGRRRAVCVSPTTEGTSKRSPPVVSSGTMKPTMREGWLGVPLQVSRPVATPAALQEARRPEGRFSTARRSPRSPTAFAAVPILGVQAAGATTGALPAPAIPQLCHPKWVVGRSTRSTTRKPPPSAATPSTRRIPSRGRTSPTAGASSPALVSTWRSGREHPTAHSRGATARSALALVPASLPCSRGGGGIVDTGRESRLIGVTIPAAPFGRGRLGLRVTFCAVCAYRPAGARPNVFSRTATAVSALSANRPSTPSL